MKSKKLLSIILALAMMFSVLPASTVLVHAEAITETISADTTWNDGDTVGGVTISGGTVTINGDVGITAEITIKGNVTFTGGGTLNRMSPSGNLIKVESGSLTLNNVTIDGTNVTISDSWTAAAINMAGGTVIMNDGAKITNHKRTSGYGPAVYMDGGNFKMNGGTISGCESRNYGGAIYLDGGSFEMNGGIIENNKTTSDASSYGGGAFYVRAAKLTINGGLIQKNSSNCGGAIYNTSYGTTIINGGVIKNNTTLGDTPNGAAIFHSCKHEAKASLRIGGNANIDVGNDIYLMSNTSATKYVEITSSIKNPLILTVEGESEGRVIADAAEGVVLTYNDMAKIGVSNSSYALKLEDNKIKLTQTSSGVTTFPVYLGYDANNGTNAPDGSSAEIVAGSSATFTISDRVPTRTGYNFLGWATDKDATSAEYISGGSITISSNTTLYAVWKKISTFETNEFTQPLTITGWTYGETANKPTAKAKYGTIKYTYSNTADGTYTEKVPTNAGTHYVKATVEETADYSGLESNAFEFVIEKKTLTNDNITDIADQTYTGGEIKPAIEVKDGDKTLVLDTDYTVTYDNNTDASDEAKVMVEIISNNYAGTLEKTFTILPKTINTAITQLTAPVKNGVPQTEIETDEYTATVVWSPGVTEKFVYNTVYTATITITPKTNYTVKGIAKNGYTVSGAETVTNEADSVTVKVVYPATENKNSNEFTQPLTITGWTYGETANTPTAVAKYGTIKYTYSNTADGTYTEEVPTEAGTHYVKATVEETADYSGLESDAFEFVIGKKTLTNDNITDIADQTYTGGEIKPTIEVKDGDKTLVLDTDYTVTYDNNTKASDEAKVTVEIISNNYAGTLEKTFTILPKTINSAITLTAPVKNEVPQTEITTDEYTATVSWSPKVTDKFVYNTVYTATITITPKANYTVKGIAENGYTVNGAQTVTNEADSATVTAVYSATENKNSNEFTQPLAITGWTYGETANKPTAKAKYGTIKYTYSNTADGTYTEEVPTEAGTHYVKATVEETADYSGLESNAVEFTILPKTINTAITQLTAPVKNEVPQTEIETDEYTATVVWSPEVEDKFGYDTVYTATITITPKANYTVKGIAENGYTVNGAQTVTNEADSAIVTAVYSATGIDDTVDTNEFTKPLEIVGWTYGDTPNAPTASVKYGTPKYTYSTAADGEYNDIVPTDAGTYYVKATVEETDKYTGLESDAVEFVIGKKILTNDNITKIADQTYTGEEIKPVIEVKDGDKVLVLDTDYTVAYEKNIKASEEAKAKVEMISNNYEGTLEKLFTILPKTINSEIILTAPVKNGVPQTEMETNEYTATVAWSPEVTDKFGYSTVYTATITITPKANYTVKGIAENGYTVSDAETVTNEADSARVTAVYAATGSKSSGGSGSTKRYTVSFNTNGGNKITSQTVAKDNSVKEPTAPIKENFEFAGWYTDKELTTKYDFTEKVTKSFKLYAKWTEQKQENDGSEDVVNNNSGNENKESSNTIVLTIDEHDALVYGTTKTNDVAPKVVNDRTMLPARFVAENLGATVEWDGEKQLVTITGKNEKQEDVTILITIGSDYAKVNGENVKLDSPAFVENDRTYTPIRFISENLGATVEWNETEQTVTIQRVK
mgnify:CR=1 FL=1